MSFSSKPQAGSLSPLRDRLAIAFVVLASAVAVARLFFGTDFMDESYQIGIGYRMVLGDRPFVDEWSPNQFFSLVTHPAIALYYHWVGSTDGIVLFSRFLYLGINILTGWAAFILFRKWFDRATTLLIAVLPVVILHFGAPILGYNALFSDFFSVGVFLATAALFQSRHQKKKVFFAGAAHGIAILSYPTAVVPVAVFFACLLSQVPRNRRGGVMLGYAIGAAIVPLLFSGQLLQIDRHQIAICLSHAEGTAPAGATAFSPAVRKMMRVVSQVPGLLPSLVTFSVFLFGLTRWQRIKPTWFVWLAIALLPLLLEVSRGRVASLYICLKIALAAPALYYFGNRSRDFRTLLITVFLPSLAAGAVAAWSSGNGLPNAGFGVLPAVLLTAFFLAKFLDDFRPEGVSEKWRSLPNPGLLVMGLFLLFYQQVVFIDSPIRTLRTRVSDGPFRGIYTTVERARFLARLQVDLKRVAHAGGRILFFPSFQAGYLFSTQPPLTHSLWGHDECEVLGSVECMKRIQADLESWRDPRNLIVRMWRVDDALNIFRAPGQPSDRVLDAYRPLLVRDDYTIFVPR